MDSISVPHRPRAKASPRLGISQDGREGGLQVWFFKKKPIETVCFEVHGLIVDAPLDGYKTFASQAYGCSVDLVETAVTRHWEALETGQLKSDDFWEKVGITITELGVEHSVPGWKFRGIWDGIASDALKLDAEMIATVRQIRAAKITTVASANLISELTSVYKKHKVFEPFSMVVLSSQTGVRKPASAAFTKMRKLAKTGAAQCLYVDKDEANLKAAKAAGYRTLTFTNPQDTRWEMIQLVVMS